MSNWLAFTRAKNEANHFAARGGELLRTVIDQAETKTSTPNAPQDPSILWGVLASWYRLYWLRFAVKEIIHHDDVMIPIIIWPRGSIAARDSHSGDAGVAKDDAEEGETSVSRGGWDKLLKINPPSVPKHSMRVLD